MDFEQDFLRRTQEREEKLNKLVQSAKRGRPPFSEKPENVDDRGDQEESPKRLCRDDSLHEEDQKENAPQPSPLKTPLRGLAALRQHHFGEDCEPTVSAVRRKELEDTAPATKTELSCPKRLNSKLSALASQINQWNRRSSVSPVPSTVRSPAKTGVVSEAAKDLARKLGSPSVELHRMYETPVAVPAPPPLPSQAMLKSPAKPPRDAQSPLKKAIWDKAVVATLESQGFTKSPSASKLSYMYDKSSVKKRVEDYEATAGIAEGRVDPAELPVSAKKAMFENKPELLTVAQKAALFNKSGCATPKFPKKPMTATPVPATQTEDRQPVVLARTLSGSKPDSPEKRLCTLARTPSGSGTGRDFRGVPPCNSAASSSDNTASFTPKKVASSPVKNLGEHTRQVHEMLFSQPQVSTSSEIAMKQKMERQREMEALKNRWNRDAPSPRQLLPEDTDPDESIPPDEESTDYLEESFSVADDSYSCRAASVCRQMDEMLDDALDENFSVSDTTVDQSGTSFNQTSDDYQQAVVSSEPEDSPVAYDITTSYKFLPSSAAERNVGTETAVKIEEQPVELMHTISFYRRQKQECSTPPMRCVVRREEVASPPSPEPQSIDLASQLKTLQEELYKQDVSLRQASQVVELCSNTPEFHSSPQHVEGERLLQVSTLKRHGLRQEIERLKTEAILGSRNGEDIGILTVSGIRLPLKREFLAAQLGNKHVSDSAVHHFFCVVKYREKVVATEMLSTNDSITAGTLCFSNHICIQGLGGNFVLVFEIYALQTSQFHQDKKGHSKKDHGKMKLTPKAKKTDGKKPLSPSCSAPTSSDAIRKSSFGLVGYTLFKLDNCRNRCFPLEKVPMVSPLEGRLDVKLDLHANVSIEEKGFLTIFEDVSGFGAWHRRWFVLSHSRLRFWKYPDDETKKDAMGSIDLKQCVSQEICLVSRDVCARPNTFQLLCVRPQSGTDRNTLVTQSHDSYTVIKYLLSADTKEERIIWCRRLSEALNTLRMWNTDALRPIEMTQ